VIALIASYTIQNVAGIRAKADIAMYGDKPQ